MRCLQLDDPSLFCSRSVESGTCNLTTSTRRMAASSTARYRASAAAATPSIEPLSVCFVLQLRVPGVEFMGCGEAGSEEGSQEKAAEMFCNLLVEKGVIDRRELAGGGGQNLVHIRTPGLGGQLPRPPVPLRPPPQATHYNSPINFQERPRGFSKMIIGCLSSNVTPLPIQLHLTSLVESAPLSLLPPWPLVRAPPLPPLA